jgi:hypothetical protein
MDIVKLWSLQFMWWNLLRSFEWAPEQGRILSIAWDYLIFLDFSDHLVPQKQHNILETGSVSILKWNCGDTPQLYQKCCFLNTAQWTRSRNQVILHVKYTINRTLRHRKISVPAGNWTLVCLSIGTLHC